MPSMNVSMTPELIAIVQAKVESGRYNNASEVVREAVRQMDENADLLYELKMANLKNIIAISDQQFKNGEFVSVSYQDIIDELDAEDEAVRAL